jgi:hypothetical protein
LSDTPSRLRRAGAAVCVCVILGGALAGCSLKKSPNATPSPAATANPNYAKSTELAANLKSLGPVIGDIQGTMSFGGEKLKLAGSVALNATASRIRLVESGTASTTYSETVVDGNRYTSHDDNLWVFRGTKAKGQDLATLLATADTSVDAGVDTVNSVTGHRIVTAPDKVDVAPALGLDTYTFDQETTTLRVWADDAGAVLGFGASMSWKVLLGGNLQDVTAELDVMFAVKTTPVEIAAPKDPWKWDEHRSLGMSYAFPGPELSPVNAAINVSTNDAGKKTLAQSLKEVVDALSKTGKVSGTSSMTVDGEDARWFTYEATSDPTIHQSILLAIHETVLFKLMISGLRTDQVKLDLMAGSIVSTVEFMR